MRVQITLHECSWISFRHSDEFFHHSGDEEAADKAVKTACRRARGDYISRRL